MEVTAWNNYMFLNHFRPDEDNDDKVRKKSLLGKFDHSNENSSVVLSYLNSYLYYKSIHVAVHFFGYPGIDSTCKLDCTITET